MLFFNQKTFSEESFICADSDGEIANMSGMTIEAVAKLRAPAPKPVSKPVAKKAPAAPKPVEKPTKK